MNEILAPNTLLYFPDHISSIEEFKCIAKVYDTELRLVWKDIGKLQECRHFAGMSDDECAYWEKILCIRLTGEETPEDRRRNIKGRWASSRPYTEKRFKEILDAMIGETYYKLQINRTEKTLKVSLMLEAISKSAYIYDLMRAMAPADMVVYVEIIFNRHRAFRTYTHADLSKYTHEELRTSTIFKTKFNTHAYLGKFRHGELSSYMHGSLMNSDLPER